MRLLRNPIGHAVLSAILCYLCIEPASRTVAARANERAEAADGLVAAYGFEEGTGGLDGAFDPATGPQWSPQGRFGKALLFDGVDDWITVQDASSLDLTTTMTAMAWVKPMSTDGWRTVLLKERPDGLSYGLYSHNDQEHPAGYVHTQGIDRATTGVQHAERGVWTHLAVTLGDGQLRIYVNGVLERSEVAPGAMPISADPLRIGGNNVWGEYFHGLLDEIRIYDRSLSLAEIRADMLTPVVAGSAPPPTSTDGLVAAYSFNDGLANDETGLGHTGLVSGPVAINGPHGAALLFDGVDDLVSIAPSADLDFTTGMTLEAWVYPGPRSLWRSVILKGGPAGLVYGLYANSPVPPGGFARIGGIDRDARAGPPLAANTWSHLAVTYDGAMLKLWVNGVLRATRPFAGSIEVSDGALFFGGNDFWGEFFDGAIDNVRLYNRALGLVEIQTNMATDVAPADTVPPVLTIEPANGSTVNTTTPLIKISYADNGSGIDVATYTTKLNGVDYTNLFTITPTEATYVAPLGGGQHTIEATIKDKKGNLAQATSTFRVSAFRALPQATPTSGTVPLVVNFTTKAEYTDGAIIRYRWDFRGDGIYDTNDPGARNYSHTYTIKGTFNATLEVLNDKGQIATAVIPITVTSRPPVPSASINPSNGAVPLQVNLFGSATDADGTIVRYEWDFEGDGTYDFTSTTTGNTSHTYAGEGTFNAVFRVTDNDGLTATAVATATAVRVGPPGSPTATITVPNAPRTVTAPTTVAFNGTGSAGGDPGASIVRYEWDFNGDGVYEFSSPTTASTSFQYTSPGTFTAALRVTDDSGLTGIDTVDITVNILATLSILGDNTCRPHQGGTVTVRTTLGGPTRVTLILKDRSGATVRTLVSGLDRPAGTYSDLWDCTDASANVVRENVYYAVLQYVAGGEVRTVDHTNTTGGALSGWEYLMEGQNCFSCNYIFRPLQDDLLDATFTIPAASEMSLSIRLFNRVDEVVSVFDRRLYGTGTHNIQWDGADVQGRLVAPPPGEQFMFGLTRFTLPNNAIFVQGRPEITAVAADPNYFDPAGLQVAGPPITTLSFNISKPATVVLQVFNTTTNRLLRTVSKVVIEGANSIAWDGRTDSGLYADVADYRLSLRAVDSSGNQSIVHYARVRLFY
jgi:flagellar hook assembly protein FlgD